jgi:hypothetical protein
MWSAQSQEKYQEAQRAVHRHYYHAMLRSQEAAFEREETT